MSGVGGSHRVSPNDGSSPKQRGIESTPSTKKPIVKGGLGSNKPRVVVVGQAQEKAAHTLESLRNLRVQHEKTLNELREANEKNAEMVIRLRKRRENNESLSARVAEGEKQIATLTSWRQGAEKTLREKEEIIAKKKKSYKKLEILLEEKSKELLEYKLREDKLSRECRMAGEVGDEMDDEESEKDTGEGVSFPIAGDKDCDTDSIFEGRWMKGTRDPAQYEGWVPMGPQLTSKWHEARSSLEAVELQIKKTSELWNHIPIEEKKKWCGYVRRERKRLKSNITKNKRKMLRGIKTHPRLKSDWGKSDHDMIVMGSPYFLAK